MYMGDETELYRYESRYKLPSKTTAQISGYICKAFAIPESEAHVSFNIDIGHEGTVLCPGIFTLERNRTV